MKASATDILIELGFTNLEAQLYCELLKSAPATGYRLAQAIGKAAANVYQALGALEQKNAVLIDDGATRSYRPVAPDELLAGLESGFLRRQKAAKAALERLHAPVPSDKILPRIIGRAPNSRWWSMLDNSSWLFFPRMATSCIMGFGAIVSTSRAFNTAV